MVHSLGGFSPKLVCLFAFGPMVRQAHHGAVYGKTMYFKLGVVVCTCHPKDSGSKCKIGGWWSRPPWAKSKILSPK
jgi:hypothetical protein